MTPTAQADYIRGPRDNYDRAAASVELSTRLLARALRRDLEAIHDTRTADPTQPQIHAAATERALTEYKQSAASLVQSFNAEYNRVPEHARPDLAEHEAAKAPAAAIANQIKEVTDLASAEALVRSLYDSEEN